MKEEDIRPQKIFREYLKLSANDAKNLFQNVDGKFINCVAVYINLHYSI